MANLLLYTAPSPAPKLIQQLAQRLEANPQPISGLGSAPLASASHIIFVAPDLHLGVPEALQNLPRGDYTLSVIALEVAKSYPPAFDALQYWVLERKIPYLASLRLQLEHWPEQLPQILRQLQAQKARYAAPFPELELPRSLLRKPQLQDAPYFLALHSNKAINRHLPFSAKPNLAQAEFVLRQSWQDYQLRRGITWLAEDRQSAALIGGIGYTNWLPEQRSAEFGGRLFPQYWGTKRALQASEAVLRFGFEEMGLHRIEARMLSQNRSALHLAQRLGFRREAVLCDKILEQNRFYDVEIWSLFCS